MKINSSLTRWIRPADPVHDAIRGYMAMTKGKNNDTTAIFDFEAKQTRRQVAAE